MFEVVIVISPVTTSLM